MKQLLDKFGLNVKEQDTFLRLLELGAQPVSVLAKQVDIPRSSMYLILDNLKKQGFIEEFERVGIKYVKCIPVKDLSHILERQEVEIQETKKILGENISELKKLENKLSITPKVKFYEGIDEVEKMYGNIITNLQGEFRAIFNPHLVKTIATKYFYRVAEKLKEKEKTAKELITNHREAQEYKKLFSSGLHKIKILPKSFSIKSDTIITDEKIYMVSYDLESRNISATEIFNPALAETQKLIFDELWEKY